MTKKISLILTIIYLVFFSGCTSDTPIKGEELKGDDAKELLAGKTEKRWELKSGDEFLKMMCFKPDGQFRDQTNYQMTYTLSGNQFTVKDYKDFTFTILEISEKRMKLKSSEGKELVYEQTYSMPKKSKGSSNNAQKINKQFANGKEYGSVWKADKKDFTFTFMNDGRFFDSRNNYAEDHWEWKGEKSIQIGSSIYNIKQLTSVFFDIELSDSIIKLNYFGEANQTGKPPEYNADGFFKKGDKVDILWNEKWYPGKILEVKKDNYKVHYDGFTSKYDEWVKTNRLKKN